jgi:hypothetical protein
MKLIAAVLAVALAYTLVSAAPTPVYVPMVVNGQATAPRPAYDLRPPDGIRCFHSDVTVVEAADGAVWWNALCQDGRGQLVFRTDASGTALVFTSSMGGRGSLFVGRDRWLYLAVGSFEASPPFTRVEPVPGWQP